MRFALRFIFVVGLGFLSACSTIPEGVAPDPRDPFEGFNRAVFEFNSEVDQALVKPVAQAYRRGVPIVVQDGVGNFFGNLEDVLTVLHHLLQAEAQRAFQTGFRVLLNSTVGVAGIWDPATGLGISKTREDLGQTLGVWGFGAGPYLVLPLLGPSSLRDATGRAVDTVVDPSNAWIASDNRVYAGALVLRVTHTRAELLDLDSMLDSLSFDRYLTVRDAYLARREHLIRNGPSADPKGVNQ